MRGHSFSQSLCYGWFYFCCPSASSGPNVSHHSSSGFFADFFHSFPLIKRDQRHHLLLVLLPQTSGGTGEFRITERIRDEWKKTDREWTPERMREPKGEKKKTKADCRGLFEGMQMDQRVPLQKSSGMDSRAKGAKGG
jgi:hypothetical protein